MKHGENDICVSTSFYVWRRRFRKTIINLATHVTLSRRRRGLTELAGFRFGEVQAQPARLICPCPPAIKISRLHRLRPQVKDTDDCPLVIQVPVQRRSLLGVRLVSSSRVCQTPARKQLS
jgi:hypothetical protein